MPNVPLVLSLGNFGSQTIAPASLASARGQNLAVGYPGPIFGVSPLVYEGTSVSIVDSSGKTAPAPMFYVAPDEVDFVVPAGVAAGTAKVTVTANGITQTAGNIQVTSTSASLLTINSAGLPAAYAVRVSASSSQTVESVYSIASNGAIVASPINMGSSTDTVYLILFGTGIAAAGTANTQVTVNGVNASVAYAGPQGGAVGLDQVNLVLPASLAGKGWVNVQLTAGGVAANPVQVAIQ
jgi:uncharacterized protein (TIGR03437 family)